ncbi:MAG: hypothetical protein WD054_03765 [Gemmatimonadota bacterium]
MIHRDNSEVWTALAIGAIVGVGTALVIRARQEDDTHELLKRLKPLKRHVQRTARDAGSTIGRTARSAGAAGDEVLDSTREILEELRTGARDLIRDTREELQRAALQSVRDARKAARRAARSALR